ncbi:hypothetical protein KFL_004680050 [Klebsormidium nitens]|uniref:F-box domain-containing protein n=1 Tax=Klebsormidium nitens TaxID=105231 RepID=A0A1Y1III9_KLENI|nr:hypothetical protein KFL_004680050 [Klebsormidium nitens]|eukprot:GAQ88901.1 hypothetical protein KFL_004680050 [Klebsormidium nitens]
MNTEETATGAAADGVAQFTKLPPELLVRILCQDALEITDLLMFGATSKDLHGFIDGSAELWRTLYVRDFTKLHPEEKNMDAKLIKKRYRQKHVRLARKGKAVKWSRETIIETGELMGDFVSHARKRWWLRRTLATCASSLGFRE